MLLWNKSIGNLFTGWMVSGIEMARARSWRLCGTAGTCRCDVKEEGQEFILKAQSTNAQCRGGLTRSSAVTPDFRTTCLSGIRVLKMVRKDA